MSKKTVLHQVLTLCLVLWPSSSWGQKTPIPNPQEGTELPAVHDEEDAGEVTRELKLRDGGKPRRALEEGDDSMIRLPYQAPEAAIDVPRDSLRSLEDLDEYDPIRMPFAAEAMRTVYEEWINEDEPSLDRNMVVSPAVHKQQIGLSPSAITVFTREDIATSGATDLPGLLRMVPGMDVVQASRSWASVASRLWWTASNNDYQVRLDGREMNMDLHGATDWMNLPVDLADLERIEVIRGPGSALYGTNALAGVISLISRDIPAENGGSVNLSAGEDGFLKASSRLSARAGKWGFSLSGGWTNQGSLDPTGRDVSHHWKTRGLLEHRLSEDRTWLIDGTLVGLSGSAPTFAGSLHQEGIDSNIRVRYKSKELDAQLYWSRMLIEGATDTQIDFGPLNIGSFRPFEYGAHVVNADLQWNLPTFWKRLLCIAWVGARSHLLFSDELLDAKTYTDPESPGYQEPGIQYRETRVSGFIHTELSVVDWLTVTTGARVDHYFGEEPHLSPRLAAVVRPLQDHFVRLGVAQSFSRPNFLHSRFHFMLSFSDESGLSTGLEQELQDFMTRVIGNDQLRLVTLYAFEIGYLGRFLEDRLTATLDLYYNAVDNFLDIKSQVVQGEAFLPDLQRSSFRFETLEFSPAIYGGELQLRYELSRSVSLSAAWAHRQVVVPKSIAGEGNLYPDASPRDLIGLSGRYRATNGFLGSLAISTRSPLTNHIVPNPVGLLNPLRTLEGASILMVLGRLGKRIALSTGNHLEAGMKLRLPVSPFQGPLFRVREHQGGWKADGTNFGGEELSRLFVVYLEGGF